MTDTFLGSRLGLLDMLIEQGWDYRTLRGRKLADNFGLLGKEGAVTLGGTQLTGTITSLGAAKIAGGIYKDLIHMTFDSPLPDFKQHANRLLLRIADGAVVGIVSGRKPEERTAFAVPILANVNSRIFLQLNPAYETDKTQPRFHYKETGPSTSVQSAVHNLLRMLGGQITLPHRSKREALTWESRFPALGLK